MEAFQPLAFMSCCSQFARLPTCTYAWVQRIDWTIDCNVITLWHFSECHSGGLPGNRNRSRAHPFCSCGLCDFFTKWQANAFSVVQLAVFILELKRKTNSLIQLFSNEGSEAMLSNIFCLSLLFAGFTASLCHLSLKTEGFFLGLCL